MNPDEPLPPLRPLQSPMVIPEKTFPPTDINYVLCRWENTSCYPSLSGTFVTQRGLVDVIRRNKLTHTMRWADYARNDVRRYEVPVTISLETDGFNKFEVVSDDPVVWKAWGVDKCTGFNPVSNIVVFESHGCMELLQWLTWFNSMQ